MSKVNKDSGGENALKGGDEQVRKFKELFSPGMHASVGADQVSAVDWGKVFQLVQMILPLLLAILPKQPMGQPHPNPKSETPTDDSEFDRPPGQK